jgi:hypothetical protein
MKANVLRKAAVNEIGKCTYSITNYVKCEDFLWKSISFHYLHLYAYSAKFIYESQLLFCMLGGVSERIYEI